MECNGNCGSCAWHDNFNGTTDWYAPMRKVIAMERSHPGMITALTTNQKTYNNELNYIIKF